MKTICICGHFGFGKSLLNGQTVKTKMIAETVKKVLGKEELLCLDTHGGAKRLLTLPLQCLKALRRCKNVVILPAQNGLLVLTPLLSMLNVLFRRKLHYVVIGGWLPEYLGNKNFISSLLKRFDGIYVETQTMKRNLEDLGFSNVMVMPNCKVLQSLSEDTLVYTHAEPYKLCTFSRVMKEKGIGDAVDAVQAVNTRLGRRVYELDIFGPVDPSQKEWFASLQKRFPDYIRYGGGVPFDQSVETLKAYYALLFPTRFYTEGVPGTILDAYAAGIPVIAARWESYADIVSEATGIGYPFDQPKALENILLSLAEDPACLNGKKVACLRRFREYTPDSVINILLSGLDTSG